MTKVKVCGITNENDARNAIESGADYIGFIFAPSKRKIIKETAVRIIKAFPEYKNFVGVFLNGKKKEIEDICEYSGIRLLQLHGDETPAFCNYFVNREYKVIKVFRVKGHESFTQVALYEKVYAYLFDTYRDYEYGGTGETFDWSLIKKIPQLEGRKYFISGGLDALNVRDVVASLNPYGVDASSKLERQPGFKDHLKVEQFIFEAKGMPYNATNR
jgi:phosphoribosylanthranilate isomerase